MMRTIAIIGVMATALFRAVGQPGPPAFDVVSVKPNLLAPRPGGINPFVFLPNGFTATNATLEELISVSYATRRIQIRGGPAWIDSDRFDVIAKTDPAAGEMKGPQLLPMIRSLLKERFRLELHTENEERTVYALMSGRTPPKVTRAKEDEESGFDSTATRMSFRRVRIVGLVNTLANVLQTPVVDQTGVEGFFTFTLDLSQESSGAAGEISASANFAEAFLSAVRNQLGFRIEKQKAQVEMTVVDHAERPTAN
jgi:uncharacterized protein (TIGR03435 family)